CTVAGADCDGCDRVAALVATAAAVARFLEHGAGARGPGPRPGHRGRAGRGDDLVIDLRSDLAWRVVAVARRCPVRRGARRGYRGPATPADALRGAAGGEPGARIP